MSGLESLAYSAAALSFLVLLAALGRWWRQRKALALRQQKSFAPAFPRIPKIKWPGKRTSPLAASGAGGHFPRCPSCGAVSRPSLLEGRFECHRCGRLFS